METRVSQIIDEVRNGNSFGIRGNNRSVVIEIERNKELGLRPMRQSRKLFSENRVDRRLGRGRELHICREKTLHGRRRRGRSACVIILASGE